VLVKVIPPYCIIGQEYQNLSRLLSQLVPPTITDNITGWATQLGLPPVHCGAGCVHPAPGQGRGHLRAVEAEAQCVQPVQSCGTHTCETPKEKLDWSEIAKKAENLMRAVHTKAADEAPVHPAPPRGLRITRSYMIRDSLHRVDDSDLVIERGYVTCFLN